MWLSRAFSTWADDVPLGVHRSGALGGRQAAFEGVGHPVAGVFVGDGQAPAQESSEIGEWVHSQAGARCDEAHEERPDLGSAACLERERVVVVFLGELGALLGVCGGQRNPGYAQERAKPVRVVQEILQSAPVIPVGLRLRPRSSA